MLTAQVSKQAWIYCHHMAWKLRSITTISYASYIYKKLIVIEFFFKSLYYSIEEIKALLVKDSMEFCHKLWFSNPDIFASQCRRPLAFQNVYTIRLQRYSDKKIRICDKKTHFIILFSVTCINQISQQLFKSHQTNRNKP